MIRVLTASNTKNPLDFGGTPFSLIHYLNDKGKSASGVNFRIKPFYHLTKAFWILTRLILFRKPRGFQFSTSASTMRGILLTCQINKKDPIISFFQICVRKDARVIFIIDCTLTYLFEHYQEVSKISDLDKNLAIEKEKLSYQNARHIFCKSEICARQVIENYGISSDKVSFIQWAPNFQLKLNDEILQNRIESSKKCLNLLFVGKDSYRKGFDKVLRFQNSLEQLGHRTILNVVGLEAEIFQENVVFHGFLRKDSPKFHQIFELSHIAFLVSRREALGIAAIEYQAAGIPTVLSGVDGMASAIQTSTCLIDPTDNLEYAASKIHNLIETGALQDFITRAFLESSNVTTWESIVGKVSEKIDE